MIIGLVLGFIGGIVLGCYAIWSISFYKNKEHLLEISYAKGVEVLSFGQMDLVLLYGSEYWMFNERNHLIKHESTFLHKKQWDAISSYVPRVLEKGQLYVPSFFQLEKRTGDSRRGFGIVAGTVVESSGGHKFISIVLYNMTDLEVTMITYVALYMILYLVGTFFVVFTVRKERELNRMRRDLIANVSHELKTPIASIRAIAEVLHDGMVTELSMQHTYYGRIMTESERLEKLVLDILELSRLQSNRAQFNKVPTHADGIIPPIIDRYMMLCGDLGINLDVSGLKLENIPTLYTDEEKLITMMCTLMDNAVKFTATGGSIWVSNQINSKAVTFCIRDNGPGIRPEDMDRIFERFYKADVAHNSLGSGLGLAIAYEIARGLKEKLWVESTYGAGTSFFFTVGFKL